MRITGGNDLMGQSAGLFDGHAHVFCTDGPMVPGRRYTPEHAAPLADYCAILKRHGVDGALLVQPSFLGTDNSYLAACLAAVGDHAGLMFKGVAMTDPETSLEEIDRLDAAGVVGMRLNLIHGELPDLDSVAWRAHLAELARRGWHIEVQIEGPRLPGVLAALKDQASRLVIDHFGLPQAGRIDTCPGYQAVLATPGDHIYMKVSAPYRAFPGYQGAELAAQARSATRRLLDRFAPDRLVWGSDWPWTRHETGRSFEEALAWRAEWEAVVTDNP